MSQDLGDSRLKTLWRRGKSRSSSNATILPVLARIPFAEENMEWFRDVRRRSPNGAQFKAWEIRPRGSTA